jgi:Glycosyl transferase family 2
MNKRNIKNAPTKDMPLVSVIVPTKNSGKFLHDCLGAINQQTYSEIELIVVDNFSTDDTQDIALSCGAVLYLKGPERSPQRNYGVSKSSGKYIAIIDSDMNMSKDVIKECVDAMTNSEVRGVVIPEESFGEGFWAQCKKLERSFYVGVDWIEAARFFTREDYLAAGGYNEDLISGEDWDLSNRILKGHIRGSTKALIYHNESRISLIKLLRKKYYYATHIFSYIDNDEDNSTKSEAKKILSRYALYLSQPTKLFKNPFTGVGMLVMKTLEYSTAVLATLRRSSAK